MLKMEQRQTRSSCVLCMHRPVFRRSLPRLVSKENLWRSECEKSSFSADRLTSCDCVLLFIVSKPDCYVCLRLPTSLTDRKRTRTVWNNANPVWDETFHFRIHSQIKNILELSVHDEDIGTADDHLFTVSYDLGNVPLKKNVVENFTLNKEVTELCSVHFFLHILK
ncbi:unnamed protein product [Ranitomeya imitator]|uniref:C2 domain-containing protein n=1 Tax=Ranitomeya imitator TaxID=111125 RepID=A0ABN9KP03_9NEOB|nr:unnamed protein product [Ranitomeya imitator]